MRFIHLPPQILQHYEHFYVTAVRFRCLQTGWKKPRLGLLVCSCLGASPQVGTVGNTLGWIFDIIPEILSNFWLHPSYNIA